MSADNRFINQCIKVFLLTTLFFCSVHATTSYTPESFYQTANPVSISNDLTVTGSSTMYKSLAIKDSSNALKFYTNPATGVTTMIGDLTVTDSATIGGAFGVTGAATVGSTLGVTGDVAINTDKFTVTAASGNTSIGG